MQVDILIAVGPEEARDAILTLRGLILGSDATCRVALLLHGAPRRDFVELDEFLAASEVLVLGRGDKVVKRREFKWTVRHEARTLGNHDKLKALGEMKRSNLAVLAHPSVIIDDDKWFGKMQRPFTLDAQAMLVIANDSGNTTSPPARALPKVAADGPLIMGAVDFPTILRCCNCDENGNGEALRDVTKQLGGTRWLISSVRFAPLQACPEY